RIDRGQELETAKADLELALQRAGQSALAVSAWHRLGLGEIELRLGQHAAAARDLDAAAKIPLEDPRFFARFARARLDEGRVSEAEKLLRRVALMRSGKEAHIDALDAEIALAKGFEQKVVDALGGKSGLPPRSQIALGRAQYALGKLKEAQATLDAALGEVPRDLTARVYRNLVRVGLGDVTGGERELDKLLRAQTSTLPRYALG